MNNKTRWELLGDDEPVKAGDEYWDFPAKSWRSVSREATLGAWRPQITRRKLTDDAARRQYACAALTGLISRNQDGFRISSLCVDSFTVADAMIKAEQS